MNNNHLDFERNKKKLLQYIFNNKGIEREESFKFFEGEREESYVVNLVTNEQEIAQPPYVDFKRNDPPKLKIHIHKLQNQHTKPTTII